MVGTIRTVLVLSCVALVTAFLGPAQWFGHTTGLYSGRRVRRLWHRTVALALGLRIRVFGQLANDRPLMIASNHISWADITVFGAIADISFIAKSEMATWPFFGWLARMQGSIFVEREKRGKSGKQAREIAARLAKGDVIVLFAEGTTGDGNTLTPFKSSLFGAASMKLAAGDEEAVWIQPVAIAYTRLHGVPMGRQQRPLAAWIGDEDLVPHLRGVLARPAMDVEVHFGEPIALRKGTSRKETAQIMENEVRSMMQRALRNPAG